MKNSIFCCLVLLLIVASCKEANEQHTAVETESTESTTTNANSMDEIQPLECTDDYNGSNCYCSLEIFPETAFLWQAGWIFYYNYDLETRKMREDDLYTNSPQTFFDPELMSALHGEVDVEKDGILISYITSDKAPPYTPPGLAIQNIVDCKVVPNGKIFMVPYGTPLGAEYPTSQGELNTYKGYWLAQNENNDNAYSIAEGYIHSWKSLMSNENGKNATDIGISVNLGLRTLEPGEENNFYQNPNTAGKAVGKTGAAVYVNVLYFGMEEQKEDGSFSTMLNFARPCPIFCN